jgi:hypothetical protein
LALSLAGCSECAAESRPGPGTRDNLNATAWQLTLGTWFTVAAMRSCDNWMTPAVPVLARLVLKSASIFVGEPTASFQSSVSTFHRTPRSPMRPASSSTSVPVLPKGGRNRVGRLHTPLFLNAEVVRANSLYLFCRVRVVRSGWVLVWDRVECPWFTCA